MHVSRQKYETFFCVAALFSLAHGSDQPINSVVNSVLTSRDVNWFNRGVAKWPNIFQYINIANSDQAYVFTLEAF